MKKIITPLLLSIFAFTNLFGQQEPVKLCAQVEQNGTEVAVNVYVNDFVNISSYQFGVAWESDKYDFVSVENVNSQTPALHSQVFDDVPDAVSLIRTLWFDETAVTPQTLADETLLYTVMLTANDPNITGLIGIAPSDDFLIEFSNGNVELVDHVLDGTGCSVLSFVSLSSTAEVPVRELSVSPNPFNDEINISLEENLSGKFSIYSTTGKLVKQFDYSQGVEFTLPLGNLEPGAYILSFESEDGSTLGQSKIVKL